VTVRGGRLTASRPLRHRDFRLLWTGLAISLVGSGLWLVALAWQVIELGGGPAELSLVTALFSVGLLAFVLVGGVADRLPQRFVMLAADVVRAAVLLVLGLLSLSGDLRIWHLAVGGLLVGAGEAFFIPSYAALLPHLLPEDELLAANGLEGTLRPLAQQAAGPALGGVALLQRRVPEGLRGRVSSLDFFVSLALMPVSMAIAGPAGAVFGITAVFVVAGVAPTFLAVAAIVIPRLDRDELAHPLDYPSTDEPVKGSPESTPNEPKAGERR
jgi:MFS family permease